jgi:hypothetical protein
LEIRIPNRRFYTIYPSVVGLLLGLLQTGLFFQLTFTLSSSFGTFLMVTLCWLLGSAVGVSYIARLSYDLRIFLILALIAYFACAALLGLMPFNTNLWPLYAVFIVLSGVYPGVFFARSSRQYRISDLFFRENNGFILGLVLGTFAFMLLGRVSLWVLPLLIAACIFVMGGTIRD